VPAARDTDPLLDEITGRLPDQRSVGKEPDLVGRWRGGNDRPDGLVIIGVGRRGEGKRRSNVDGGDSVDQFARQPHST
jgi:hypothetical protein